MDEVSEFAFMGDTVTLDQLKVAAQTRLSPSMASTVDGRFAVDAMTGQLIAGLSARVQAQQIAKGEAAESRSVVIETPATTWQMFKSRHDSSWWLRWLVRRRPVRMIEHVREVTMTAVWTGYATFPDSSLVIEDGRLGRPVYYLQRDVSWRGVDR